MNPNGYVLPLESSEKNVFMSIKKLCIRNIAMHMLMHMYLNINDSI